MELKLMISALRPQNILASCLTLAFVLGCARPQQSDAVSLPSPGADGEYSPDWPDLGRGDARYIHIELGDSFETCRHLSPKFPFDSAHTRAQDRAQLRAFAACMNHPELAGLGVLLIGRADPRGTATYNDELGAKRAERVKQLLVADGLASERIKMVSQGEAGAMGDTPDQSYGYDRRVDVIVQGGVHTPGAPRTESVR
jgi:outer membrane protein OmpA-like peptidoglycan-associated protein